MSASVAKSSTASPTLTKAGKPSRLSLWVKKLPDHNLAFNPTIAQGVKAEINDLESTSERLAELIQQDPALSLSLYQYTQPKVQAKEGDIQSLVHMIGLMGLGHIEHTLTPTPKPLKLSQEQKSLYAASIYAAQLAKQLLPLKHGTVGERFFLPALFFNAPLWLMWQAAPKIMGTIQQVISEQGQPITSVFRARLGFELPQLLKRCHEFLTLPKQTLKALNIDLMEDATLWAKVLHFSPKKISLWLEQHKKEKLFFYSTEVGIYLINQYSLALYFDHSGKYIKRFHKLLSRHLKLTDAELDILVNKTAVQTKNPAILGEESSPQIRIAGLDRDEPLESEQEKTSNTVSAIHTDPLALLKLAKTQEDALQLAQQSLVKMCRASQCIIFNYTKKSKQELTMSHQSGFDESMDSFSLDIAQCGQFFKKILLKPIALFIKDDQIDHVKKQLPRPLLRFWSPSAFSILSVYHHNEPLAIIISNNERWDNEHHLQFKRIGKTLMKVLKHCP